MHIESFTYTPKQQYNASFKSNPFRVINLGEKQPMSDEFIRGAADFYKQIKHAHAIEYLEQLSPRNHKPKELEDLYSIISQYDIADEIRCPGPAIPFFLSIPPERLQVLKPIILSKNDIGLWNYNPKFILDLDKCNDKQIEIMSKLTACNIHVPSLLGIISNPHLNWDKTVEKAQSLRSLFGKNLREVSFFSNSKGQNYLSADIQLPHSTDKPDYFNFQRVYARLDDDVNPLARMNSKAKIDTEVKNIYTKLEKKLQVFTEKDLNKAIFSVLKEVPEATEQEVLSVMQRLTQFANYSSLKPLSKQLNALNIGEFCENGELNPIFTYLSKSKKVLPLDQNSVKKAYIVDGNSAVNSPRGGGGPHGL
ncbi:MAG: hypothetical protein NC390_00840, partial [Fusobacterium sp.]|nr:hypothetical protein [Fusobacterium sp.]